MTAFAFDPYAVLAQMKNREPAPATVATPATEYPSPVETVATVAGIAGAGSENEESGAPAIFSTDCPISDLFESIGMMDENGGQEVHDAAARDLGYSSFDAALKTIVAGWAKRLGECDLPAVEDARANWHWCEIAARLGWCAQSLWGRFSGLIPRLRGEQIARVHRDYVVTSSGSMLMRCPRDDDRPIWEDADATTLTTDAADGRQPNG